MLNFPKSYNPHFYSVAKAVASISKCISNSIVHSPLGRLSYPCPPVSLLLFLFLVLLAILGGLGGQRAHCISNGFIVGIHTGKVL